MIATDRTIRRSERSIQQRFLEFHRANPQVYEKLVEIARAAKSRGRTRLGINMLWEVLRWNVVVVRTVPNLDDDFKLNDHFASRYVRLIVTQEPDLADMFELRNLRSP